MRFGDVGHAEAGLARGAGTAAHFAFRLRHQADHFAGERRDQLFERRLREGAGAHHDNAHVAHNFGSRPGGNLPFFTSSSKSAMNLAMSWRLEYFASGPILSMKS